MPEQPQSDSPLDTMPPADHLHGPAADPDADSGPPLPRTAAC
jgi:hypothetical protein